MLSDLLETIQLDMLAIIQGDIGGRDPIERAQSDYIQGRIGIDELERRLDKAMATGNGVGA